MNRKQQVAFRRAWLRCDVDLRRVEELKSKETDEFRLEMLKKREEVLRDDRAVFKELIVPNEEFTSSS